MVAVSTLPQPEQVLVFVPVAVQVAALVIFQLPNECLPVAGTVSCALITALQTEQCLPSVSPVFVQVAATASSITSV